MPEHPFAELEESVRRAAEALQRLRAERDALRERVATLEARAEVVERRDSTDHAARDRLQILDEERTAVRQRLSGLLNRLEEISRAE